MKSLPNPNDPNTEDVWRTLHRVNPWKAAVPYNIPGWVLKECTDQVLHVLTDIYIISLNQTIVPHCTPVLQIHPYHTTPKEEIKLYSCFLVFLLSELIFYLLYFVITYLAALLLLTAIFISIMPHNVFEIFTSYQLQVSSKSTWTD